MRRYFNELYAYFTFGLLISPCYGGLLDYLLGNNVVQPQRTYGNNNQDISQLSQAIQNLAATRDRYNAATRNNNWARRPKYPNTDDDDDDNDDAKKIDDSDKDDAPQLVPTISVNVSPTNVARNTNTQNVVNNQVPGTLFTNGDDSDLTNQPLVSQLTNRGSRHKIHTNNPIVSRPITNRNTGNGISNLPKIIDDVNKINSIVNQIKQQNPNNGNTNNIKTSNRYPSYTNPSGYFNNYPLHVNTGQGVHTNMNNNNPTNPVSNNPSSQYNNIPLSNIQDPNLNNAVTNPSVVTLPPGNLMTNDPNMGTTEASSKENSYDDHKHTNDAAKDKNNAGKRDDKYELIPITKRKFFVQVKPVVPFYKISNKNETVYYVE